MEEDPRQPESDRLLESIVEKNQQLSSLLRRERNCGEQHLLQQVIGLSRDLSTFHLEKVTTWRETLQVSLDILPSGTFQEHQTDKPPATCKASSTGDAMHGLVDDLRIIEGYLQSMQRKLDTAASMASDCDGDSQATHDLDCEEQSSQSEGQEPVSLQNQQANPVDSDSHDAPGYSPLNPAVSSEDVEQRHVGMEMTAQPSEAGNGGDVGGADHDLGGGGVVVVDVGHPRKGPDKGIPGGGALDQGMEEGVWGGDGREQRQEGKKREGWVTRP
ncbi:hypothetical protein SKAU_G00030390 [Synaphobranchus kaupii]|uniref:Uncharacterized protein n=1 Tax=Synaphobranchus kaupii TaxID=118154 RepID=A0A9Q1GDH6_SYNKA|nr:hypothetical protein SKAU_G00030390 [Synaphobranchus kaupii]